MILPYHKNEVFFINDVNGWFTRIKFQLLMGICSKIWVSIFFRLIWFKKLTNSREDILPLICCCWACLCWSEHQINKVNRIAVRTKCFFRFLLLVVIKWLRRCFVFWVARSPLTFIVQKRAAKRQPLILYSCKGLL